MRSSHDIDSSWDRALQVVHNSLNPSPSLARLTRLAWDSSVSNHQFAALYGLTGLSTNPIIGAAREFDSSIQHFDRALAQIGPRIATLVASAHVLTAEILSAARNERVHIPALRYFMNHLEVGYHLGMNGDALGPEMGMLIGFAQGLGPALLVSAHARSVEDPSAFLAPGAARLDFFKTFGCEPQQVASLALQRLGYGPERATTAALALGRSRLTTDSNDHTSVQWRAAADWISAFLCGRKEPFDAMSRRIFPELDPSAEGPESAAHLAMLYAGIDEVRENTSTWKWHLPLNWQRDIPELAGA